MIKQWPPNEPATPRWLVVTARAAHQAPHHETTAVVIGHHHNCGFRDHRHDDTEKTAATEDHTDGVAMFPSTGLELLTDVRGPVARRRRSVRQNFVNGSAIRFNGTAARLTALGAVALLSIAGCSSSTNSAQPTPTSATVKSSSGPTPSSDATTTSLVPLPPALPGHIAFRTYSDASGTSGALFVTDSNGAHERRLTEGPTNELDDQPNWSPDGSHIIFTRFITNGDGQTHQLVSMSTDATNVTPLTPGDSSHGLDDAAAYSPDGHYIAYVHASGTVKNNQLESFALFVRNSDGTQPRQVTSFPAFSGDYGGLAWSPDGKQLVFARWNCAASPTCTSTPPLGLALFLINVDGTGQQQLTDWSLGAGGTPDWSPNGDLIVFRAVADEESGIGNFFTIHPDGTGLTQVTHFTNTVVSHKVGFSPDGRWIVFAKAGDDGVNQIFIATTHGNCLRQVTHSSEASSSPDWG